LKLHPIKELKTKNTALHPHQISDLNLVQDFNQRVQYNKTRESVEIYTTTANKLSSSKRRLGYDSYEFML